MNIQKSVRTIRSYGTPSVFSGVNLWTYNNETHKWSFNGQEVEMTNPPVPVNSAQLFTGGHSFQRNLELLNNRLNTIHKELTYWDLYKITDTVMNEQSFPSIISALAVGNSAVINCDTFSYNQQQYHRGDVIVKINDTQEILIPAVNTGVYVPMSLVPVEGNSYTLKYSYTEAVKESEKTKNLNFELSDDSAIYGNTYDFTSSSYSCSFPILVKDNAVIKPVVKTFVTVNNTDVYEEIVLDEDITVAADSTEWSIEVESDVFENLIDHIYVQVK